MSRNMHVLRRRGTALVFGTVGKVKLLPHESTKTTSLLPSSHVHQQLHPDVNSALHSIPCTLSSDFPKFPSLTPGDRIPSVHKSRKTRTAQDDRRHGLGSLQHRPLRLGRRTRRHSSENDERPHGPDGGRVPGCEKGLSSESRRWRGEYAGPGD